ncbi:MAG: TetR/AcrR family transcriptional regulator [candidate division WOR-3 bacterium]
MEVNTKNKLLESGIELFSQKGYDATSIQEICEKAGVSKGAFFHYFPSKEFFFLEILDHWLKDLFNSIEQFKGPSEDPYLALSNMSKIFKDIFRESRSKFPLYVEFLRVGLRENKILAKLASYFDFYTEYFSNLIKPAVEKGHFVKIDPKAISKILIAYALGIIEQELFAPQEDWETISKQGIEIILRGLMRR